MSLTKYTKLVKELKSIEEDDKEDYHIKRDDIYEEFIKDIVNNKIKSLENIVKIAKLINKDIINVKTELWYA